MFRRSSPDVCHVSGGRVHPQSSQKAELALRRESIRLYCLLVCSVWIELVQSSRSALCEYNSRQLLDCWSRLTPGFAWSTEESKSGRVKWLSDWCCCRFLDTWHCECWFVPQFAVKVLCRFNDCICMFAAWQQQCLGPSCWKKLVRGPIVVADATLPTLHVRSLQLSSCVLSFDCQDD